MKYSCVLILAVSVCFIQEIKSCLDWKGNWKLLDGLPWNVTTRNGARRYQISLCRPLKYDSLAEKDCDQSALCMFENGTARSLINFSALNESLLQMDEFYYIHIKGLPCPNTNISQEVSISFICDEHLNLPQLLLGGHCYNHFMWKTSAACNRTPKRKEVPCYTYNEDGRIIDLTPLIKRKGAYSVTSADVAVEFFINVCSDIFSENETERCPQGAGACRKIGSEVLAFGSPDSALFMSDSNVKIVYNSVNATIPAGCNMPPHTTVTFVCPPKGRGHSPRLIATSYCQYEIEWQTEYSCPMDTLVTNLKTCKFTRAQHGVELDLSPLKKETGGYRVLHTAHNKNTTFLLNICGGLGEKSMCGRWQSDSVCLNDSSGKQITIGTTKDASLRYSDGSVTLTYRSSVNCNSSTYKTIIEFQCEPNAENNGTGQPEFVEEEDCIYFFNWKTKYACPKHPLSNDCYVNTDGIHIDLGMLIKNADEEPWQVINTLEGGSNDSYYLNVCGSISRNFNGSHCEEGTALCRIDGNGNSVNFGTFISSPIYNKQFKTAHLMYKDGDSCGSGQRETSISFICKPGILDSPPVLERISEDGCVAMIQWHTAAACPQATKKGSDCKVIDEDMGLVFDLNPLKKDTYYKVKTNNYTYYLNICDKVKGTLCDEKPGQSQNAAACQEDERRTFGIKLGEPNSELLYIDGMINLTYTLGMPYNDKNKTPRTTSITFLCNETAGVGHPEFLEEAHHAYSFRWYSNYACPANVAVECLVRDPHTNEQYDLSRLTKTEGKENWITFYGEENETKKFYLNICRQLTYTGTSCSSHASACVIEMNKSKDSQVINLGQMTQPPTVKSNGLVELVYTNGDPCVYYGINTTYNTTIHFTCGKTDKETLVYIGKQGRCQYVFLLETSAACPVQEAKSEHDCSIKDPVTGVVHNFMHLKTKFYNVTFGARKFQVNICGTISGGCQDSDKTNNVTVCETDENGNLKKVIGILNDYSLQMSEDKIVTLVYNGLYNQSTGAVSKVYITFTCDKLGVNNRILFKQEVNSQYYFELSSPMVCASEWTSCTFSDDFGNNYDLTPLARRDNSNWEVVDTRPGHSDLRYHINFCKPVNPTEIYKCPVGAIGACQTSIRSDMEEGYNLGSFEQHPIVQNEKVIVPYTGGMPCNNGQYNRSTEIVLYCSELQSEPVFIGESQGCKYYFSMHTPAACPLKVTHGNDCAVIVPEYGYHIDLSPLRQTKVRYQVKDDDYEYLLNVCAPIADPPPNCIGAGACQTKPSDSNFAVNAGKSNSTLHYNNGVVQLVYESGKGNCHRKYNRSTVITFICSHEISKDFAPRFLSEKEDCTYLFEWPTSLVCLEHQLEECSVSSGSEHYDLSLLSLSNSNYLVPFLDNKYVVINVCKTLSPNKNVQKCSQNSAACIIGFNINNVSKATNIGKVGAPYVENGVLKLSYTHGDTCGQLFGDEETRNLQTTIEFECDEQKLNGEPQFVGIENCTFYFTWSHTAACPIKSEVKPNDNCTATHPITGFIYDLSPLKHGTFYNVKNKQHEFNINVCAAVNNSTCGTESGSCQREIGGTRVWNSGNYNSRLHFHENSLILNYTNGAICHGRYSRNTIIQFTCGIGNGHPSFLRESDECTYYFSWSTVYACEDRVHCVVPNGSEIIDLTSLSMDKGYHTAVDLTGDNKYIINVCGPLNGVSALCHNAGVCHIGSSTAESLGRPHGPPFIDFLGHVTVIYSDGSPCNSKYNNTARIVFSCDPNAGMGEPSLTEIDENMCHYVFEWKTNLICSESKPLPISDCKFLDANKDIYIDLSPLRRINSSYEVKGKRGDEKFTINICGSSEFGISDCSTAGVCFHGMADKENYGSANSAAFSYSGGELTLTYNDGGSCPLSDNGKRSSRILFTCDQREGIGSPVLHKQSSCLATFKWKTSLLCIEKHPECTLIFNNSFYDLRMLSSITHSWNISDDNGNTYWLNVCRAAKSDVGFGNCINTGVCMKHNNGTVTSLGTLYSWKLRTTNSGEIILTYENGDKVCSGMTAVSSIKFICGKTMGKPKFISGPSSSCKYEFTWETTAACAEIRKEVLPVQNHKIFDSRLEDTFDMSPLFKQTFSLQWKGSDPYLYVINLSGVKLDISAKDCANAAICQTKPPTFYRDIGTVSTEKFYLKGNELQLELTSYGRKCGKNENKNVTTIINFVCVTSAGVGNPSFYYESGDCDYLFDWETDLVCPKNNIHHIEVPKDKVHIQQVEKSSVSYTAQVIIAVILSATLVGIVIFIVSKEERRNAIRRKVNNAFINFHLPTICYRRAHGETLLLSSAAATACYDESDVEILT